MLIGRIGGGGAAGGDRGSGVCCLIHCRGMVNLVMTSVMVMVRDHRHGGCCLMLLMALLLC